MRRTKAIILIIIVENLLVGGLIFLKPNHNKDLAVGFSSVDLIMILFLLTFSSGLLYLLLNNKILEKLLGIFKDFSDKKPVISKFIILGLIIISYESLQDILFLQSPTASLHYQGYTGILEEYILIMIWAFLVSLELLIILLIIRNVSLQKWIKNNRLEISLFFVAFIFILFLHVLRAGNQLGSQDYKWFEELNAPILGIQVLSVIILLVILKAFARLGEKNKFGLKSIPNSVIVILLVLIAFVLWDQIPLRQSSFLDTPRPPNFEFYPRSDALNYEISAYQLLVGNGTGRTNHVGFWHYLALRNFLIGDGIRAGVRFNLLVLALIPGLLYLSVTSLSDRFSGLVASLLFIVRELNGLLLVEHITIQNIKEHLTEPFVILGIVSLIYLLTRWAKKGGKSLPLLLLTGGILGWMILLRVDALVYIPAVGIGIVARFWKNISKGLLTIATIVFGAILVAGPWMLRGVLTSGSLLSLGLGREHLVMKSVSDLVTSDEDDSRIGFEKETKSITSNIGNNIVASLYYLPSNHQPFLTVNNIPDLVLNRVDPTDYESDTYHEKYLERYVRGLPFWWNDWNGKLEPRSILPLLLSLTLVAVGYCQVRKKSRWIALILVLIALFHIGIFSLVGKSGGRFIRSVDWIPIVFFSIGISFAVRSIVKDQQSTKESWLWRQDHNPDSNLFLPIKVQWLILSIIFAVLLGVGLSFPYAETSLPQVYTDEKLEKITNQISNQNKEDPLLQNCLDLRESGFEIAFGKALFPRYFDSGQNLDGPGRNYTDSSIKRVEFFLTGSMDIWAAVPGDFDLGEFEHGSEVIVVGKVLQVDYNKKGRIFEKDYLKSKCILLLD